MNAARVTSISRTIVPESRPLRGMSPANDVEETEPLRGHPCITVGSGRRRSGEFTSVIGPVNRPQLNPAPIQMRPEDMSLREVLAVYLDEFEAEN